MADEDNRFRSYASRVSTKAKENKSSGSSGFKSSSGSQNRNDNARKSNNEKQADQLAKLQNQGQGNSTQARLIQNQLASSDAKADKWNAQANRPMSFDEKMDAAYGGQLPGYMQDNINSQIQNYQDNPPKLEPKEITLADGTKMMTYGSFEPGQFSNPYNQYIQALKYGSTPYSFDPVDSEQGFGTLKPASDQFMDFGFGSVFGDSSGSTASSDAVQNSLQAMMQDLYNQGYSTAAAGEIAMDKMYPGYIDYSQGKGDIPVNFMDMNVGAPLPGHQMTMNTWQPKSSGSSYNYGGGYGGDGGGGGGGEDGGGYGGSGNYGSGSQVYQRGSPNPGNLQERVNQSYLSGGRKFARGGIVSLLRL